MRWWSVFAAGCLMVPGLGCASASGEQIHTAGVTGAYHSVFCPLVKQRLGDLGAQYNCMTSPGSAANVERIARQPSHFAFSQLDVFALESPRFGGPSRFQIVRSGDVRECVFAVSRNKSVTNFGQIAVNADRLKFVLPPVDSGSARTFRFLQDLDPEGLARARDIVHTLDTDDAIRSALSDKSVVAFFVQFPDPDNERFKMVRRLGLHIIPVIDQRLFARKIGGRNVYFAQRTRIRQAQWLRVGPRVVTACTPLILFTGAERRVRSLSGRAEQREAVARLKGLAAQQFVPATGPFARLVKETGALSTQALGHFLRISNDARERALPFVERAYRSARRGIREMILKARPQQ